MRYVLSLHEKKFRRIYGEYIVEGIKQVREALACVYEIVYIVRSESYSGDTMDACTVVTVSDGVFTKLSDEATPQGILAVLKIPNCAVEPPQGVSLLLDGIADPGNLGTIIRTANAAGFYDIYLRGCADPFSLKCVRASMSGIFFVRLHIVEDDAALFAVLQNIPCLCADMEGENVFSFRTPNLYCLVIGNEANGVSASIRSICTHTVRIPMQATCESLNAGVAAGILMYILQQNKQGCVGTDNQTLNS